MFDSLLLAAAHLCLALWNVALVDAAKALEADTIYDPAYVQIDYPGGDVDPSRGVCTDVIIRAYRGIGKRLSSKHGT